MAEPGSPKPSALEARAGTGDGRRQSPSVARNRDVIRDVFLSHVTDTGQVLEIASGTGEHGLHITAQAPGLTWHFSDPDPEARASIAAWIAGTSRPNLVEPHIIHADAADWGDDIEGQVFDAIACINMVHIAPFAACEGLIAGAGRRLKPAGALYLYGPFARNGVLALSNAAFSETLRARDPAWGVRDLDLDLVPLARRAGLALAETIEMPANNLSIVFRKTG
jgi:SAM-dependent methyltransferase